MNNQNIMIFYRCIILFLGGMILFGAFQSDLFFSGFDRYILHFEFKDNGRSYLSTLVIMIISTFPFFARKSRLYDELYTLVAIFALSFLSFESYNAFYGLLSGVNVLELYRTYLDVSYDSNSIFFRLQSRAIACTIICIHLLFSFRLILASWKNIFLIFITIIVNILMLTTILQCQ